MTKANKKRRSVIVPSGRCSANWLSEVLKDGWFYEYQPCFNGTTGDMRPFRFLVDGGMDPSDAFQMDNPN